MRILWSDDTDVHSHSVDLQQRYCRAAYLSDRVGVSIGWRVISATGEGAGLARFGLRLCARSMSANSPPADVRLNPWHPMTNAVDVKHLGKLNEEANELGAATARCIIQGISEREPVTGKLNSRWLEDEIADVLAGIELCIERFDLDQAHILDRMERKKRRLKEWHVMA